MATSSFASRVAGPFYRMTDSGFDKQLEPERRLVILLKHDT
jgi:hypothetical protein